MFFKNLFSKKTLSFKITNEVMKNKRILFYEDLFKVLGMTAAIEELRAENENKKYHYKNIRANNCTIQNLNGFLTNNLVYTKNKWSKMYKEQKLHSIASFNHLMWSPFTDNTIADDEIVVLKPNHKDFTQVTTED